jgi:hypothetical protein
MNEPLNRLFCRIVAVVLLSAAAAYTRASPPIEIGSQLELFVDP